MDSLPKLRSQSPLSTQTILPDCTENQTVTKVVDNRQVKE